MPRPHIYSILETNLVASALRDMFLNLSTWTPTSTDKLVLDISIYSTSDFEYGFKDLTFRPDISNQRSLRRRSSPVLLKIFDQKSTYIQAINGERSRLYPNIRGTFGFIGRHGIFDDSETENFLVAAIALSASSNRHLFTSANTATMEPIHARTDVHPSPQASGDLL